MSVINENCGHPISWITRLVYNGRTFTYCMGCLIEKSGLDNLEVYNNPYIKKLAEVVETETVVAKPKTKEKLVKE